MERNEKHNKKKMKRNEKYNYKVKITICIKIVFRFTQNRDVA